MRNVAPEDGRIAQLSRELEDLRSRHDAVAEILRALSRSGMRLQPILDQIAEAAARLGRSDSCLIWLTDGEFLRYERALDFRRAPPSTST